MLPDAPILLGVVGRAHGVRGLVRVTSHTADPAALSGYGPLSDPLGRRFTLRWMGEGIAEIFEMVEGTPVKIADRTAAERLTNTKLFIERNRLPPPEDDEYYLADLIGLAAVDADGVPAGVVMAVHDYGAGVSLEIARDDAGSLLVPFTATCVPEVNVAAGRLTLAPPDEIEMPNEPSNLSGDEDGASRPRHTPALNRHSSARPGKLSRHDAGTGPRDEHEHEDADVALGDDGYRTRDNAEAVDTCVNRPDAAE